MSQTAPVSVIIPCYRCASTIERAVASVAAQTNLPAEVVLIDDASGDNTRSLLEAIRNQYPVDWVKLVLLDKNVGAGSSRNRGWSVATQQFIAFLDADDAWHPEKIEVQFNYMIAHPDIVLSGHEARVLRPGMTPNWSIKRMLPAKTVKKWPMILKNPFVTPSVMLRRGILLRFDEHQRYMEDHMLWMRVVCAGERVVKLPVALAAIYKNSFGIAGLSSNLWKMERGDLGNYYRIYKEMYVNLFQFSFLVIYSVLKHFRRLAMYITNLWWIK